MGFEGVSTRSGRIIRIILYGIVFRKAHAIYPLTLQLEEEGFIDILKKKFNLHC